MSSMLALRPGATDLSSSRHHLGLGSCGASQGMLHRGSCSGKSFLDSGLPTPPATTAMTAVTAPNGRIAYPPQYSYQSEQRLPEMNQVDSRPTVYASNGKIPSGQYMAKPQQQNQSSTRNGQRPQEDQIAPHLQIPESVNSSKGSLSEFAAKITCLFWFETSSTLEYAEALHEGTMPNRGLNVDAIPTIGFTKWVTTILSTTQVGRNVVLLALMFIYRLKKFNPSVSGKRGSEFRLLTIALMLGNKFLDDNTYTNKTWAEVSGISVNEIHIMEVEFLSNMRYELYASADQWQDWKAKLNRFGSFYEKASKINNTSPSAPSPTTPIRQSVSHRLSSPPSGSKHKNNYATLPNPLHTAPYLPRSPAKQYQVSEYAIDRKRSFDGSLELPPAKRIHSTLPASSSLSPAVYTPQSAYTPDSASSIMSYDAARLPQLQIPTLPNPVNRNESQLAPLGLPAPRAMSTVYPVTASHPHPMTPTTSGPPGMPVMANSHGVVANSSSRVVSHTNSAHTSPTNLYGNSTPTRPGLSPSYFLMNRSSPYRPVRHVNTLLYPPPSAAMQTTSKNMDYQQMQYQPLSKNTSQLRPGPMPCLQPDAWAGHISTPVYRQY